MEAENQQRGSRFGIGIAAALLIVAALIIGSQLMGGRQSGAGPLPTTAFYTDDNGKGFFKDDINKISPFDHNGKQAYRCSVFQGATASSSSGSSSATPRAAAGTCKRISQTSRRTLTARPGGASKIVRMASQALGCGGRAGMGSRG